MSDQNAQEPTMEEILASIRRIISEDEPASSPEAAAPAPAHAPEPLHEPLHEPEPAAEAEDVLELTDRVPEPERALETHGDLDVLAPAAAAPPPLQPILE